MNTYTIKQSVEDGVTLFINNDDCLTVNHIPYKQIEKQFEPKLGNRSPEKQELLEHGESAGVEDHAIKDQVGGQRESSLRSKG